VKRFKPPIKPGNNHLAIFLMAILILIVAAVPWVTYNNQVSICEEALLNVIAR